MARVSNPRHKRRTLTTDAGAKVLARAVKEAVRMRVPPSQSERVAILLDPHTARVAKTLLTTDQRYAATMSTRDAFVKLDCEAGGSKPEEYAAAGPGLLLHHRHHPQKPTPTLTLAAPDCISSESHCEKWSKVCGNLTLNIFPLLLDELLINARTVLYLPLARATALILRRNFLWHHYPPRVIPNG